ncbi:MAG: T9SS type A sorting domain-containing protein [Ferruginibacter sp.]|nr:T9SS type A sorting domain-containing protein [Ferruginibacter sp.]
MLYATKIYGIDFTSIGSVAAFNTNGQHNYNFNDANPFKQLSFYRLKQIDINGSFTLSNIVKINVDDTKYQLRLYPNPTVNKLMIDWKGSGKNVLIKIIDSKGAVLETKTVAATNLVNVNVSTLTKGMYYIELNDGEIVKRSSFINQ